MQTPTTVAPLLDLYASVKKKNERAHVDNELGRNRRAESVTFHLWCSSSGYSLLQGYIYAPGPGHSVGGMTRMRLATLCNFSYPKADKLTVCGDTKVGEKDGIIYDPVLRTLKYAHQRHGTVLHRAS